MLLNIYCDTNSKAIYDMRLTQSVQQQTMVVKLMNRILLSITGWDIFNDMLHVDS